MYKRSGLTLIELLIVLSLVVTLAGLVTPRFVHSYQSRQIDHFVKELASYLRYLQFKAVAEGTVHKVVVEPESGALASFIQTENMKAFKELMTPFSKRFQKTDFFSVSFERGHEIYFFPDGRMTKNKLFISSELEKKATLEIKNRIGAFQVTLHD